MLDKRSIREMPSDEIPDCDGIVDHVFMIGKEALTSICFFVSLVREVQNLGYQKYNLVM
jgi:uncharacterized protein (UPF0212 family)